ncbi:MAG: hypothetical protein ACI4BA_00070 [Prevotella sp.]
MRKSLLFVVALCSTLSAWAGVDFGNATELQMGENSKATSKAADTCYFKYTAIKDVALQLTPASGDGYSCYILSVNELVENAAQPTGFDTLKLNNAQLSYPNALYPVQAGKTVYVALGGSTYGTAALTLKLTAALVEDVTGIGKGATADDPVVLEDEKTAFVGPLYATSGNYSTFTYYATYTATKAGVLNLLSSCYVQQAEMNGSTVSFEYTSNGYLLKQAVAAGETYTLKLCNYSPIYFSKISVETATEGSLDMPFELKAGTNKVPAGFGDYYYTYKPSAPGYVTLSSSEALTGGKVKVFNGKSNVNYGNCFAQSAQGSFNVTFEATSTSDTYYLLVSKVTSTDGEQTIEVSEKNYSPGEREDNPVDVTMDNASTDVKSTTATTFYWNIKVPAGKTGYLTANPTTAFSNSSTKMIIYPKGQNYYATSSATKVKYLLTASDTDTEYTLRLDNAEGKEVTLNVGIEEVKAGDEITNPIVAVQGNNTLDADGTRYYTYTMQNSGKLVITGTADMTITFPRSTNSYDGNYTNFKSGVENILHGEAGKSYFICVNGGKNGDVFTLAEKAFEQGDTKEMAIAVEGTTFDLAGKSLTNLWIKYNVQNSGKLKVSSSLVYNYQASILYCINDGNMQYISPEYNDNAVNYSYRFDVKAGDIVYVNIIGFAETTSANVTFEESEAGAGESAATAIDLSDKQKHAIVEGTSAQPVWVKMNLTAGTTTIKSSSYFGGNVYQGLENAENLNSWIYLYGSNYGPAPDYTPLNEYVATLNITEEGTYYFAISNNYGGGEIYIAGSNVSTGISTLATDSNIKVRGNVMQMNGEGTAEVYNITGMRTATVAPNGQAVLNKGINLIKTNGKTYKVMVK